MFEYFCLQQFREFFIGTIRCTAHNHLGVETKKFVIIIIQSPIIKEWFYQGVASGIFLAQYMRRKHDFISPR